MAAQVTTHAVSLYVVVFVVATALNFTWEMAQAGLYRPMGALLGSDLAMFRRQCS